MCLTVKLNANVNGEHRSTKYRIEVNRLYVIHPRDYAGIIKEHFKIPVYEFFPFMGGGINHTSGPGFMYNGPCLVRYPQSRINISIYLCPAQSGLSYSPGRQDCKKYFNTLHHSYSTVILRNGKISVPWVNPA